MTKALLCDCILVGACWSNTPFLCQLPFTVDCEISCTVPVCCSGRIHGCHYLWHVCCFVVVVIFSQLFSSVMYILPRLVISFPLCWCYAVVPIACKLLRCRTLKAPDCKCNHVLRFNSNILFLSLVSGDGDIVL